MIRITTDFWGYPAGKKRRFAPGEKPDDISADYADMLVRKNLAARADPAAVQTPSAVPLADPAKGKRK